jgi:hypothetical protein
MNKTLAMFTISSGEKYNTTPIHEAKQLPQLKGLKLIPHLRCRLWIVLKNNDAQILVKII